LIYKNIAGTSQRGDVDKSYKVVYSLWVMARELSGRQAKYVKNRARGLPREQSAIIAGYSQAEGNHLKVEDSPNVQQELAKIRSETAANIGITKDDVAQMLYSAYTMAVATGDAQAIVAAARELGKLLGHYAPTVNKTLIGYDKEGFKKALSEMSDEELYKLAHARTIDGEAKREPEPKALVAPSKPDGSTEAE
jgi:phage terminase small subunit